MGKSNCTVTRTKTERRKNTRKALQSIVCTVFSAALVLGLLPSAAFAVTEESVASQETTQSVPADPEGTALKVSYCIDEGETVVAKSYTWADLRAIQVEANYGCEFLGTNTATVVASNAYVPFTTLFEDAGVDSKWISTSTATFMTGGSAYAKYALTYADTTETKYFFPALAIDGGTMTKDTTSKVEIPAALLLGYNDKKVESYDNAQDALNDAVATFYDAGSGYASLRNGFGLSETDYANGTNVGGNRFCSGITEIVINYTTPTPAGKVAKIGSNFYSTLAEAVTAAKAGDTIKLTANNTLASELVVTKNLTLDLNGFDLSGNVCVGATADTATSFATLTVKNSGSAGTVKGSLRAIGYSVLNLGTVAINALQNVITTSNNASVVIDGATVNSTYDALALAGAGTSTIKSGTFTSASGIALTVSAGTCNVSGGSFSGAIAVKVSGGTVNTIAGGKATFTGTTNALSITSGNAAIASGTFTGFLAATSLTKFITGGTFSTQPAAAFIADGHECTESSGSYTVSPIISFSGLGTQASPYLIQNAQDLDSLAKIVNAGISFKDEFFELKADISLTANDWIGIGSEACPFEGTFDGKGFTVSGIAATTNNGYKGLFGNNAGTIKNLTVAGSLGSASAALPAANNVGGLVGYNSGTVTDCSSRVKVYIAATGETNAIGVASLVGCNAKDGKIINCASSAGVNGTAYAAGGICGYNKGSISTSYNSGSFICGAWTNGVLGVGGIAGANEGTIEFCYNAGAVTNDNGKQGAGGIAGANSSNGTIGYCYNTGNISAGGTTNASAICGKNEGTVKYSYTLDTVQINWSGTNVAPTADAKYVVNNVDGSKGTSANCGTKTATELKGAEFLTLINNGTTNFVADTSAYNYGYPVFAWQTSGPATVVKYDVTYVNNEASATGTLPDRASLTEGTSFQLPACELTYAGHHFAGWQCSADGKTYKAGASYVMPDQAVTFTATWGEGESEPAVYTVYTNTAQGADATVAKEFTESEFADLTVTPETAVVIGDYTVTKYVKIADLISEAGITSEEWKLGASINTGKGGKYVNYADIAAAGDEAIIILEGTKTEDASVVEAPMAYYPGCAGWFKWTNATSFTVTKADVAYTVNFTSPVSSEALATVKLSQAELDSIASTSEEGQAFGTDFVATKWVTMSALMNYIDADAAYWKEGATFGASGKGASADYATLSAAGDDAVILLAASKNGTAGGGDFTAYYPGAAGKYAWNGYHTAIVTAPVPAVTVAQGNTFIGKAADFTATVANTYGADVAYKWEVNKGNGIWLATSGTEATYANYLVKADRATWQFRCTATINEVEYTSEPCTLKTEATPTVTVSTAMVTYGSKATFKATVKNAGSYDVSYLWQVYKGSGSWINCSSTFTSKATYSSYTAYKSRSNWRFRCIIKVNGQCFTSSACAFKMMAQPVVTVSTSYVKAGSYATFKASVKNVGSAKVGYLWQVYKGSGKWVSLSSSYTTKSYCYARAYKSRAKWTVRCIVKVNGVTAVSNYVKFKIK